MHSNTTSLYPTHFLRGVELVDQATRDFSAASENWPCPSQYKFGMPIDEYYAEVWENGMDWQKNYWVIEEIKLEDPIIQPLIIFENHEEEEKFNHHDFGMLIKAALYYRRDSVFIQHKNYGCYKDLVWPFLYLINDTKRFNVMEYFMFQHANQQPVQFWMNPSFIPEYILDKKKINSSLPDSKSNVIKFTPPD